MNRRKKSNKAAVIKQVAADEATDLVLSHLNEDGYLIATNEELLAAARAATANDIRKAITRIRRFGPHGVGHRTLRECLLAQLRHQLQTIKRARCQVLFVCSKRKIAVQAKLALEGALYIVDKGLPELQRTPDKAALIRKWARELDRPEALIQVAIESIRSLNPRPGQSGHSCPGIAGLASASRYVN